MAVQKFHGESLPEDFIVYIRERASQKAVSLVLCGLYSWNDKDDLSQDLLLDLLRRLPRFNESRGNVFAFVFSVMQNRASVLATRKSRRHERLTVPLHRVIRDIYDSAGYGARSLEPKVDDFFHASDLKIDVRKAMRGLPSHLKGLAQELQSMTVPEICAGRGKSRSRVYQMIGEIRVSFTHQGLRPETRKPRP
jgi:RNA polymerase sigma-70 factor (ECF subfamily)